MVTVVAGETQSNQNMAYNETLEFTSTVRGYHFYRTFFIIEHFGSLSQIKFEIAVMKMTTLLLDLQSKFASLEKKFRMVIYQKRFYE